MRPFAALMPYPEALAKALQACRPGSPERIPLGEASGRVLAADVHCPRDLPPAARAAMDGYAVAAGSGPVLDLAGHSHLGDPFRGRTRKGACVEIATCTVDRIGTAHVMLAASAGCAATSYM